MKRRSTSLIIREMHINATVRHHLIQEDGCYQKKLEKTTENNKRQGCEENGTLHTVAGGKAKRFSHYAEQ